jgi:hypothetical protein
MDLPASVNGKWNPLASAAADWRRPQLRKVEVASDLFHRQRIAERANQYEKALGVCVTHDLRHPLSALRLKG